MGLDMYLFKTQKNKIVEFINQLRDAVDADTSVCPCIEGYSLVLMDANEMHHVDKLGPAVSWIKAYDIHNWFSRNVLRNAPGKEDNQLGLVTSRQLQHLITWCREQMQGLSLAITNQAYTYMELFRTCKEAQYLLDTTDFATTYILYFAYW